METVRIRTPQALLRLLPRLVGDPGAPSLVALPFDDGRSGMPMVLDLPDEASAAGVARAIREGALGADAVVLVACLAGALGTDPLPLRTPLLRVVEQLEGLGVGTLELLALGPDAWGDYAHPAAARGPLAELDLLDDPAPHVAERAGIPAVPEGEGDGGEAVARWLGTLGPGDLAAAASDPLAALELAVALAPQLAQSPGAVGDAPARAAALAIALVARPAVRDLAIQVAVDGVDAAADTLAALDDAHSPASDAAASRFLGIGPPPDVPRLHERLRRWSAIAVAAPLEARAPLLVIVGFLHFFLGRGRTAGRCAELASAIDPALTMAPLLREVVDAKRAPDWVLDERGRAQVPRDRER
ncbi:DUF4192 family protein [Agrococcus sp. Marseille-P2731]|uniref:DUF4192 family protein n=1 Tax=Agrococcus sp. Marseille-P2731 TaxID=1841862 RepID=UPI0009303954|nr:DUF4192 family protein [Agrococcus sp. Marseille-P2731]